MTWQFLAFAATVVSVACLIALFDQAVCEWDAALEAAFNP